METTNVPTVPTFKVISSTPSTKGGFVVKVRNISTSTQVDTGWGVAYANKQETYYLKLRTSPTIGQEAPLDLNLFDIKERDYVLPEGAENAGDTIQCKWLSPKA